MSIPITRPFDLPSRTDVTPENIPTRWDIFIGQLASGVGLEKAVQISRIDSATIETMCRLPGGLERQRFNDARLAGFKTTLSALAIEHFFNEITSGKHVKEAMVSAFGSERPEVYQLINSDPDMHAQYRRAQKAAMYHEFDEIKGITDDTSRDVIESTKLDNRGNSVTQILPNNAAVGRDKLRMDARFKRAGILNRKVFGEDRAAAVTVNVNYADTLEQARARAADRGRTPRVSKAEMAQAVEAVAHPVESVEFAWMNEAATNAVWREES